MAAGDSPVPPAPVPAKPGAFRHLGATGPLAIVLSIWPPIGGFVLLATLTRLGPWLQDRGPGGWLYYLLIAGGLVGLSFVPTYACSILAGWAFGFTAGWPLAVAAMTAGSLMAYGLGRLITRERLLAVVQERPKWRAVHRALLAGHARRTLLVVALLRLPPLSPFALANFVLAAAKVPLREYTVGTAIGILPRTAMTTYAAAQMVRLNFEIKSERWVGGAWIAVTLVICLLLGAMANRALRQVTADPTSD